jgi:cob(I)alamin adenosyltransferase
MKQMGRGFVKVGAEKPDPEDIRMVEEAWAEADRCDSVRRVGSGRPR